MEDTVHLGEGFVGIGDAIEVSLTSHLCEFSLDDITELDLTIEEEFLVRPEGQLGGQSALEDAPDEFYR